MSTYFSHALAFRCTKAHGNADAMSRLPLKNQPSKVPQLTEMILLMEQLDKSPITASTIKLWTSTDPLMSRIRHFVHSGWPATILDDKLKHFLKGRLNCPFKKDVFCGETEL